MSYTIGEAARRLGMSTSALRYYDKEGLLPGITRTEGGVRQFSDEDLAWMNLIECLKKSGLPIKDIKRYIDWHLEGDSTLEKRRELFHARRRIVEEQIAELERTLAFLSYKCWYYDTAVAAGSIDEANRIAREGMPEDIRSLKEFGEFGAETPKETPDRDGDAKGTGPADAAGSVHGA